MFQSNQYQALDFGDGRRLERFGELVLDRPCPAAASLKKKTPARWATADAVFHVRERGTDRVQSSEFRVQSAERGDKNSLHSALCALHLRGFWIAQTDLGRSFFPDTSSQKEDAGRESSARSATWQIRHDQAVFELRGTPFGHIGLFPEQAENWDAIQSFCRRQTQSHPDVAFRVLNLFASTGGSTLAAALGGAEVVHLDAAKNVVAWAGNNAEMSQIARSQIRWLAEDARKYVRRERNRSHTYHGVILDPPSYGHGARGEVWQLSKHLPELLFDCFSLLEKESVCFLLLTCHTPGYSRNRLTRLIDETIGDRHAGKRVRIDARTMILRAESGATLPSGESVMVCYGE